ncbi:TIGR02117 family protein [Fulvimarina sp. MAC3]|uniref:TIGR02117 family protein n=1 Tax=Fulvimarina sp. MAC3 TaxID=3148887 RepID=UPI0031FD6843
MAVVIALTLGVVIPRGGAGQTGNAAPDREILILANAIHTDLALPLDEATRNAFGFVETAGLPIGRPDARWLLIGWGGEQFYVNTPNWSDLEVLPVVQSILGDRSVLRVGLMGPIEPDAAFGRTVSLTDTQYRNLIDAIVKSFQTDAAGQKSALAVPGYGAFDRFYPSKGRFQVLFGCNTWTGEMLRKAGLTTGLWTPLPFLLDASLDLHAPVRGDGGNG